MDNFPWLRLLRAHCKDKVGLSLPFLVGGNAYPSEVNATVNDALTIVGQMKNLDPSEGGICLSFCAQLLVPLFTLYSKEFGTGLRVALDGAWGNTDLEKIEKAVAESKGPIESAQFSRVKEEGIWCWRQFTPEERAWIADALRTE